MSSNSVNENPKDRSERTAVLNVDQFRVIFQVTVQLYEFQESRLRDQGCSPCDLDILLTGVRAIRQMLGKGRTAEQVRIVLNSNTEAKSFSPAIGGQMREKGGVPDEIRVEIPQRIANWWPALLQFVVSALGERETFYRTGYRESEITSAVNALTFA